MCCDTKHGVLRPRTFLPFRFRGVTNYLYPFEFNVDHGSWRASVYQYQKGKTRYVYYKQTNYLLADSWWYCSFCLRKIRDFVFKMKAYSHTNQVRFSHFLDPKRIQNVSCNGMTCTICFPRSTLSWILSQKWA